jgi:hypothetical protein
MYQPDAGRIVSFGGAIAVPDFMQTVFRVMAFSPVNVRFQMGTIHVYNRYDEREHTALCCRVVCGGLISRHHFLEFAA